MITRRILPPDLLRELGSVLVLITPIGVVLLIEFSL